MRTDKLLSLIKETARSNYQRKRLVEKLNHIYENHGENAARKAYDSLSEEEQTILEIVDAAPRGVIPNLSGSGPQFRIAGPQAARTPSFYERAAAARQAAPATPTAAPTTAASSIGSRVMSGLKALGSTVGALSTGGAVLGTTYSAAREAQQRGYESGRVRAPNTYNDNEAGSDQSIRGRVIAAADRGQRDVKASSWSSRGPAPAVNPKTKTSLQPNPNPDDSSARVTSLDAEDPPTPKAPLPKSSVPAKSTTANDPPGAGTEHTPTPAKSTTANDPPGAGTEHTPTPAKSEPTTPTKPSAQTSGETPALVAAAITKQTRAERPIPGSGGGSYGGQPEWARKAFNPDTGA